MENNFFKIQKTIVKIGTPTILIKTCWRKIKFIWALISQMCKSYEIVNHWILPPTFALFELQHWLVWIMNYTTNYCYFSVFLPRFHIECIYLIWILKTATLFVYKSHFLCTFFFKKALYLEKLLQQIVLSKISN